MQRQSVRREIRKGISQKKHFLSFLSSPPLPLAVDYTCISFTQMKASMFQH